MSAFAIVTDSSCDLNEALRTRFGIDDYIPGNVIFPDGHTEKGDLDWKTITPEAYYTSMSDKKHLYKTSMPNPVEVEEHLRVFLDRGQDILSISLSSGISGTYDNVCMVAQKLMEQYPERKILCVDSLKYCAAVGMLCIEASRLREEGKTIEETADWLNVNRFRLHQTGPIDDLFFCSHMGRISNGTAFAGTLIGIRSLGEISRKGLQQALSKARGEKNALRATVGYMQRTVENPEEQIIFICHSNREKVAHTLGALVEEALHPKEIIYTPASMSCGAGIGPGLCAVFYFGKELTEDLSAEAALLEAAIKG